MTIGAVPYSGPAERRGGDGSVLMAVLLAFGVVGWEQVLHTGPGGPPFYQVLHWLSDSLLALPLGLAAVWLGTRLASRQGAAQAPLGHARPGLPDRHRVRRAARAWRRRP